MKTTLYMAKGLPASGKSRWAKQLVSVHGGSTKRVNKDDLRSMLDNGGWSKENEEFVLQVRDMIVRQVLVAGKSVIVDDTNLAPKHEERLRRLAKQHYAEFKLVDFTAVDVEECIRRDQKRPNYVGEKVIRGMHREFLAKPVEPAPWVEGLPTCVIVDIDGTVALGTGRNMYDETRVSEDEPNTPVCELVAMLRGTGTLLFVSGRKETCRVDTTAWLEQHLPYDAVDVPLFMRKADDNRDDRIVKQEIYEREIKGKYNVRFVLDDRSKVVAMWRSLGIPCFQVAPGDF